MNEQLLRQKKINQQRQMKAQREQSPLGKLNAIAQAYHEANDYDQRAKPSNVRYKKP